MDDVFFEDVVLQLIVCFPTWEVFNVCQFESTCFMQCLGRRVVCEFPRSHTGDYRARRDNRCSTELRRSLGRSHCLRWRQYRQRKRCELQIQLVDAGQRPGDEQWRHWQRPTLDVAGRLRHIAYADTHANSDTHTDTHAYSVTIG